MPKAGKNFVLFVGSLFFYAFGEPKYVFLMLGEILMAYVLGLLIERSKNGKVRLVLTLVSSLITLSALLFFKYTDFFIRTVNTVSGAKLSLLNLALPIGISFYTFQILSYTIDVYRGNCKAQKNFVNLGAYITMFPQLIAGPIVRYTDIEKCLQTRTLGMDDFAKGIRRFVIGLGKKVIIANTIGEIVAQYDKTSEYSILFLWVFAISICLQLYFDFSGYSDMAIGLGLLLGFQFPENFRYPFEAKSATDFWRRWHISLGSWFRDYVYIPLGGNRKGPVRGYINIFIVWAATGFWHGASWNFVIWGLYFAILLIMEKLWFGRFMEKTKVLGRIYMFFTLIISFVIFNFTDMAEAVNCLKMMFGGSEIPLSNVSGIYCLKNYGLVLALGIIGATHFPAKLVEVLRGKRITKQIVTVMEIPFCLVILLVTTSYLVNGSFNPFLYFRF